MITTGALGSGKTTLLTLCGSLRSIQSGSLQVLTQELYGASAAELTRARRHNGHIFQAHNLHQSLTVLQNVRMGLEQHNHRSQQAMMKHSIAMLSRLG